MPTGPDHALAELKRALKELVVEELDLRDRGPDSIASDAPLFGEGLGLDSLDALQLVMAIEERYGVQIPEGEEARAAFASIDALAAYIVANRGAGP